MDSRRKAANHATVMKVARRDCSAMHLVNVHVTITSRDDDAIGVKRTSTIVIKAVSIVPIATIWSVMRPTIIVANWPI